MGQSCMKTGCGKFLVLGLPAASNTTLKSNRDPRAIGKANARISKGGLCRAPRNDKICTG